MDTNNYLTVDELLFNDEPITINRKLAKCLGLTEAVIFQQIHYWLKINEKTNNNFKNGRYWTYNSIANWQKNEFDFLSEATIKRKLQKLEQSGLLETNTFNKMKGDKTKWYTINYNKLLEACKSELNRKTELSQVRKQAAIKSNESKKDTISAICTNGISSEQIAPTISAICTDGESKLHQPIPKITTKTSTKTSISSSIGGLDLCIEFKNNICELKRTTEIKFKKLVDLYNDDFILSVIEECAKSNIKSYQGFETVINSYLDRNCRTREEVKQASEQYRSQHKKSNNISNAKTTKFNNFIGREYDYEELEKKLLGWDN